MPHLYKLWMEQMLTKFDIGQHVNFWYSSESVKPGVIVRIEIDKESTTYWVKWDGESNAVTMDIPEEDVFTN